MYVLRNLWRDRTTIISTKEQNVFPFLLLMHIVTVDNIIKTERVAMYAQKCAVRIVAANSTKHV